MLISKINKLVYLSQQTYQPNAKLISSHNDKGYGTLDDEVRGTQFTDLARVSKNYSLESR